MQQIKVNIIKNKYGRKPEGKEMGYVNGNIWKDENIREMNFRSFANAVGNFGCCWKSSLVQGGSSNDCFKEAYVLSLDFDDNITIEDFTEKCIDLGLVPSFMYKTFSHTEEHHKFRAVWRLNEVIDNPQLKTALQLMLMKIFPQCDEQCSDLSRLWVGGKELFHYDDLATLNLNNLRIAVTNVISVEDTHNATRNIKAFCKKLGLDTYDNFPYMINESSKPEEICPHSNELTNYEMDKNPQCLDEGEIVYDGMRFKFDTNSYNTHNNKCNRAKQQNVKGEKVDRVTIKFDRLQDKCFLFNEFCKGVKISHNEIKHISFNLYDCKGYPTLLENTLKEHNYNNWENKYNTLASAVKNRHRYDFSSCAKHCRHYYECDRPFTIKEKYYGKEGKIEQVYQPYLMPLADAEKELDKVYNIINNMTKEHFLFVRAVTGLGKTELLKRVINGNVIVGVSNHKLGEETYDRLKKVNPNILYVKALDTSNMTKELKDKVKIFYDLGLYGDVRDLCIEEMGKCANYKQKPKYYNDMKDYLDTLEKSKTADTMLMTHCRISFGNNNSKIDTIILDEDFLKSFINYESYKYADIFKDLDDIAEYCEKMKDNEDFSKEAKALHNAINEFNNGIKEHKTDEQWFENSLKKFISSDNGRKFMLEYTRENKHKLNCNIFKVLSAEYVCLKQEKYLHTVCGDSIKLLNKYKVVVMSATIDEEIHPMFIKKYLPKKKILFKDISNVETMGGVLCDCAYAFSRQSLANMTEKMEQALDKILSSEHYNNVISFMDDNLIDVEKYGKQKILYYGNCEGIDQYKGQNLAVIGTPHTNSVLYEAYNVLLSGNSPKSTSWKVKQVEKYGYKFDIMTYTDEEDTLLTRIQLYCLYSELIQAVGRARVLRTNAKVYVFSALPLPNSLVKDVNKSKMKVSEEVANEDIIEYINNAMELEYDPHTFEEIDGMTKEQILKELDFDIA